MREWESGTIVLESLMSCEFSLPSSKRSGWGISDCFRLRWSPGPSLPIVGAPDILIVWLMSTNEIVLCVDGM